MLLRPPWRRASVMPVVIERRARRSSRSLADERPEPPVAPGILYERMMALFDDPALAERAVDAIAARRQAEAQTARRREGPARLLARAVGIAYDGYSRIR